MKRYAIQELYKWKEKSVRKPLILQGARQVGKTWIMQNFAKEAFQKSIYVNFESNTILNSVFEKDFDIKRILFEIQLATELLLTMKHCCFLMKFKKQNAELRH